MITLGTDRHATTGSFICADHVNTKIKYRVVQLLHLSSVSESLRNSASTVSLKIVITTVI